MVLLVVMKWRVGGGGGKVVMLLEVMLVAGRMVLLVVMKWRVEGWRWCCCSNVRGGKVCN